MRIVSLVPSLTELLFDLGLSDSVVGRTRFCIHPKEAGQVEIVGGTKNPKIDHIRELNPDLIIMNKEENRREDAEALSDTAELLVTDIDTVDQALQAITRIGARTGTSDKAENLVQNIKRELDKTSEYNALTAAYLIWKKPYMTIGEDTYIHDVMRIWGLENVFAPALRYPETDIQQLRKKTPNLVLLSSEPYPFSAKHVDELNHQLPDSQVLLVNGEFFSWYGSRMLPAFRYLNRWRGAL